MEYPVIPQPALNISSMAAYPYHPELEGKFWFESKFEDGSAINLSRREGNRLYVPRNCATVGPKTEVAWTDGHALLPNSITIRKGVKPRDAAQERVLFESNAWLDRGQSHIIKASTALGKTFVGCILAAWQHVPTLIVVPKSDLMGGDQWGGALTQFLNLKPNDIGIIRQNKCDVAGKAVVMAMVHSLAKDKYPDWIKDYFGLVIFDEVHRMAAETFHLVAGMFRARRRLGLTADTKRPDGRAFVFEAHIGPVLVEAQHVKMKPKVLVVQTGVLLPRRSVWNPKRHQNEMQVIPHKPGKMPHVTKILVRNQVRNGIIIDAVLEAYSRKRRVLILSDLARDKYLNALREMIKVRGVPDKELGFYVSGMSQKQLDENKRRRVVLATYGMCGEATNVPEWDTLIMATPRSNIKQAIGRILRPLDGKLQPIIIDLVDEDSWVCNLYLKNRMSVYQSAEISADIEHLS